MADFKDEFMKDVEKVFGKFFFERLFESDNIDLEKADPDMKEFLEGEKAERRKSCYNDTFGCDVENGVLVNYWGEAPVPPVPSYVTVIGRDAFCDCDSVNSVVIPEGVTLIEEEAFWGCHNMTSITLPSSLITIEKDAFKYCNSLTEIHYMGDLIQWCRIAGHSGLMEASECEKHLFIQGASVSGKLVIPRGVTGIEEGTFCNCCDITSVVLGSDVRSIRKKAFARCPSLTAIMIGSSVRVVEPGAFAFSSKLERFVVSPYNQRFFAPDQKCLVVNRDRRLVIGSKDGTIPKGVRTIGELAFCGSDISSFSFPSSVTKIEAGAFRSCNELVEVTLPDSVTHLGREAFANCANLRRVVLSAKMKMLESETFIGCASLTEAVLPQGLTEIEDKAFRDCRALSEVALPSSLRRIGEESFMGCLSLKRLSMPSELFKIGARAFRDCRSLSDLSVNTGLREIKAEAFRGCFELKEATYRGTSAEWNAMLRARNWKNGTRLALVRCLDRTAGLGELD